MLEFYQINQLHRSIGRIATPLAAGWTVCGGFKANAEMRSASSTEGALGVLDSIAAIPTKAGCRPLAASLASCIRACHFSADLAES